MVLGIGRKLDDPWPGAVPDADGTAGMAGMAGPARPRGGPAAAAAVAGVGGVGLLRTGRQPWDG